MDPDREKSLHQVGGMPREVYVGGGESGADRYRTAAAEERHAIAPSK